MDVIIGWGYSIACYGVVIFFIDMLFLKSMIAKAVFKDMGNLLGAIPGLILKGFSQGFKKAVSSKKKKQKNGRQININVSLNGNSQDQSKVTIDDD